MNLEEKCHVTREACESVVRTMREIVRQSGDKPLDSNGVQRIQLMAKTLKDLSIAEAMWCEQEEGGEYSGRGRSYDHYSETGDYSGRRMRSQRTGRWYSGDGGMGGGGQSMGGSMNSMDGGSMDYGGNSYGGDNQQMIAQMEQMLRQMKQNQ